ncbi:MAG TPA: hypothetical protein VMW43_13125 [Bacteroidota bacterium]|nr:hypothetical protein [Bacteroidota bacterium]
MIQRALLFLMVVLGAAIPLRAAGNVEEVDAFHRILHPLVHDAYPAHDFGAIRDRLPKLLEAAEVMRGARLPGELSGKQHAYRKLTGKLYNQLKSLEKRKNRLKDEKFGVLFMEMHDTFEKINDLVK